MRAAAILGLGPSPRDLKPFQKISDASWLVGLPAAPNEAEVILIFGGDGTVHRHLAQLVKLQLPVLVVPAGSGNDFARALDLHSVRDSLSAWKNFASSGENVRTIDLGLIVPLALPITVPRDRVFPQGLKPSQEGETGGTAEVMPSPNLGYYFCCVAGCGLDAEVARRANQLPRWLRSHGGYAISFSGALRSFAPLPMNILLPKAEQSTEFGAHQSKPTVLLACANTPTYGGGMRVAPRAKLDDGKLDICHVTNIDKFKLFCLFPTVYFGRHLSTPEVEYFQAARLRIQTERPLDVYADGEYVCQTPVEIAVRPRALRVVVP